jgi:hypothetical protein
MLNPSSHNPVRGNAGPKMEKETMYMNRNILVESQSRADQECYHAIIVEDLRFRPSRSTTWMETALRGKASTWLPLRRLQLFCKFPPKNRAHCFNLCLRFAALPQRIQHDPNLYDVEIMEAFFRNAEMRNTTQLAVFNPH